jgi:hypothetical protein
MTATFNFNIKEFRVPTEEEVKRRVEQLEKKGGISLDMKDVRKMCNHILHIKNKTDICFTFITRVMDFCVLNKKEMNEQMILWKELAKNGTINIHEENNMEYEVNGKKLYTLVITPKNDCGYCPISLAWGTMVSGYTYVFTKQENRDAVYKYVKKYCLSDLSF